MFRRPDGRPCTIEYLGTGQAWHTVGRRDGGEGSPDERDYAFEGEDLVLCWTGGLSHTAVPRWFEVSAMTQVYVGERGWCDDPWWPTLIKMWAWDEEDPMETSLWVELCE
jgi:hypothetical protein